MIENILYPVVSIGALALVFGLILGFSARKFAVEADPKVERIINILPGVNCGGCGFPGCAVFAEAVVKEKADYKGCPAGGSTTAAEIAKNMGIDATPSSRKVAFVKCHGTSENVDRTYIYDGPESCIAASQLATGGNKSCAYSCIGHASCMHACPFEAIKIVDGVSVINRSKCTACGKCVAICPKNLIEIVPDKNKVRVMCNSRDKGKIVKANCHVGCLGCKICQRVCPEGAITVENNLARIDYQKCTMCMECVDKCPATTIKEMP